MEQVPPQNITLNYSRHFREQMSVGETILLIGLRDLKVHQNLQCFEIATRVELYLKFFWKLPRGVGGYNTCRHNGIRCGKVLLVRVE